MKNVLLIYGGGGDEHGISVISSKYLKETLDSKNKFNVIPVEIGRDHIWRTEQGEVCELNYQKELVIADKRIKLHVAIPCIHGYPGETGELPAFLEVIELPFIGCGAETSHLCFNKVSTKLWFTALNIPSTPFVFLTSNKDEEIKKAISMQEQYGDVFVKAASQGSSVGCFPVAKGDDLKKALKEAFVYSDYVLVEKMVKGREFVISVYEYDGEVHASYPGEIICPSGFYSYEEKYSETSKTTTALKAENLDDKMVKEIQAQSIRAFKLLNMKDLCRIDFFIEDGEIYLNEPNTFPGMTPISLFPKMMEANGHNFADFLVQIVEKASS